MTTKTKQVQHTILNPVHRLHRWSSIIDESLCFFSSFLNKPNSISTNASLSLSLSLSFPICSFAGARSVSGSAAERWLLMILKKPVPEVVSSLLLLLRSPIWDLLWPNQLMGEVFEIPFLKPGSATLLDSYFGFEKWKLLLLLDSFISTNWDLVSQVCFFGIDIRLELNSHRWRVSIHL